MLLHKKTHDDCGNQIVHQGRDCQGKELIEFDNARLPDHQGGNVPKGAEGPAGVGGNHDINAAQIDEAAVTLGDFHDHRTHQQGRCEVVGNRRNNKSEAAGYPEQGPVTEAFAYQPGTQCIKDAALLQGIDIGHCHQQEQHQFTEFQQGMTKCTLGLIWHAVGDITGADQYPNNACGNQHGFRLAQMQFFFTHHQNVSQRKNHQSHQTSCCAGQVDRARCRKGGGGKKEE